MDSHRRFFALRMILAASLHRGDRNVTRLSGWSFRVIVPVINRPFTMYPAKLA